MANKIPEDVKNFIVKYLDSIAQWEGLLLMRTDAGTEWDAKAIANGLYIKESEGVKILSQLSEKGFITETQSELYKYSPFSPEAKQMIDKLASMYRQYLVPITHIIHYKAESRIQQFADAFRIKKD
jgi:hypothetical protein